MAKTSKPQVTWTEIELPDGKGPGLHMTCAGGCSAHPKPVSATMHRPPANEINADRVHQEIWHAHHPFFSRSTQFKQHGPWAV